MQGEELIAYIRSLGEHAGVKTLFGDPVTAGTTTIVPVAKIAFGMGGGMGKGRKTEGDAGGGGGGGGMWFLGGPSGYIEMTPAGTRYVAISQRKRMAGALLIGFAAGFLAAKLTQD
jgi:uncharacterized spore protein YtfJ